MYSLTKDVIKKKIADSNIIYKRGNSIFKLGNYYLKEADYENQSFKYYIDGNYGDYDVNVNFVDSEIKYSCDCPYYSDGCKHTVAVCLDIIEQVNRYKSTIESGKPAGLITDSDSLSYDEIKKQAIEERKKRAKSEKFEITLGDTYRGEHLLTNVRGKGYIVTTHDPLKGAGHCTCPDFNTNKLSTCKHLIHLHSHIKTRKNFAPHVKKEKFPFVHVYWDSAVEKPRYFYDRRLPKAVQKEFPQFFDKDGLYCKANLADLYPLLDRLKDIKNVKIDEYILWKINTALFQNEIEDIKDKFAPDYSAVNMPLYPYQKEGVNFALFKKSAIIADEMGLGKTLQAITLAILKRDIFNLEKVLVVCPASLKEQWKREIEKFTNEKVTVIAGPRIKRQEIYEKNKDFFKITNYEAVLRDTMVIHRFKPDLIILDEAQRIKNFETKTAQAIKSISHKQSLVLSGTPLENKLEDLYSIVQFANPGLFMPLWEFAAEHFILKREKKNKIFGYRNLEAIHQKLKPLVIRRKKEDVLKDLPEQVTNNYYIDLTQEQLKIHQGYLMSLLPILNKKFLTPIDVRRIQELLTSMRMVCDSTFLIDRKTNLSPKLKELEGLLIDLVLENKRKTVIFTEWTTMTFLIGKVLSELGIPFVEFTGKIPVTKRQSLITEFNRNPSCMVFLSTDAGGVGLNLQTADCVINFELPWNPAKLNQRTGRVMRIGQKSKCVNIINLIAKQSIEEKILAGLQLKQELFDGVFDGTTDQVEFSREKKEEFINKIRAMINEEPIVIGKGLSDSEDIPESTPHFLNPQALSEEKLDIAGEEDVEEADETKIHDEKPSTPQPVTPEKMEEVLENGMRFLNGLMTMATGKPLMPKEHEKTISIDKKTGEVTMKFKLPGF
ncbi:MAG: RNA polymerase-associated protein RapA [Candidatus Scalindua arabica]|uniref:RNA polymerase-associated protein RapA n=1 Tax=Candidatus Scalindua arabica TaxID=1127984 RepID=A0A941W4A4_9BACT|nr:RNA polymerase-associated protein RapA [Candidatus Scalindua arabica]